MLLLLVIILRGLLLLLIIIVSDDSSSSLSPPLVDPLKVPQRQKVPSTLGTQAWGAQLLEHGRMKSNEREREVPALVPQGQAH
ncbi:hypothetical protein Tco_1009244, partial [Tanacetum coccineum]